ncbi:aldo/keto reductase [Limosilactobacillus sp. STM2_1]|uniref:Aldo/keto reductase n=1 Tax=Limosilactobacillus rudii TaxID=2759755 RepID=A0A7W3UJF2_9LACO|nr:aldo/keto reductase [Limosilactobacillus rudii]MBB1096609.1 aldo/keto reductase [Limosilactobacillus rudii]
MQTRILGNDLKVTSIGLGCMVFTLGYGKPTDEATAVKTIRQAYDLGYRFFDTAEVYQGINSNGMDCSSWCATWFLVITSSSTYSSGDWSRLCDESIDIIGGCLILHLILLVLPLELLTLSTRPDNQ